MSHEYKTHMMKGVRTYCGKIPYNWTPLMYARAPSEITCTQCKRSFERHNRSFF